jgi:hypothetical protein
MCLAALEQIFFIFIGQEMRKTIESCSVFGAERPQIINLLEEILLHQREFGEIQPIMTHQ